MRERERDRCSLFSARVVRGWDGPKLLGLGQMYRPNEDPRWLLSSWIKLSARFFLPEFENHGLLECVEEFIKTNEDRGELVSQPSRKTERGMYSFLLHRIGAEDFDG
jgi:hypothetical protein